MQINAYIGEAGKHACQPSDTCQSAAAQYKRPFIPHC